jgi:hypothetical protein
MSAKPPNPDLFAAQHPDDMQRGAHLSPCRKYRYALWRRWSGGPQAMFIGLNPSTADETEDDPTIRRCIAFARDWGYGALCMANLFAYRATEPADMLAQDDPIGPDNDEYLRRLAGESGVVVAAWGTHGVHRGRDAAVFAMIPTLHYLKLTKDGHPGHPLYLPANLRPLEFARAAQEPPQVQNADDPASLVINGLRAKVAALEAEIEKLRAADHRDAKARALDNRVRTVLEAVHLHLIRTDGPQDLTKQVAGASKFLGAPDSDTTPTQRGFTS